MLSLCKKTTAWQAIKPVLTGFALFILAMCFSAVTANAQVSLPVEIIGPAGTIESITFDIADNTNVDAIWMQVHNLSYASKGRMRINSGSWIDLNNDNNDITLAYPESELEGIGGSRSTIRFEVAVSGIVTGSNTVDFEFQTGNNISSGWSVLDFEVRRSDDSEATNPADFVEVDPDTWTPISSDAGDIAAGENLFNNATLFDPLLGKNIRATCGDCHTESGMDLVYFNYSDKRIIERSKFHNLSQSEGEQIASWVRSLQASMPNPGRVWSPVYQPGPGLDSQPVEEWAAGVGVNGVLDDDLETLDYIFPAGEDRTVCDTDATINIRNIPLAIQFFDWNEWLPPIHPSDFWDGTDGTTDWLTSDAYASYNSFVAELEGGSKETLISSGAIAQRFASLNADVDDWREHSARPGSATGDENATGNLGQQLWQLVKVFEIMHNYDLLDRADDVYPGEGDIRGWFGPARNLFNTAPHISSYPDGDAYGSLLKSKAASHIWYHTQMTVNPGHRNPQSHKPVDWKYQFGHIGDYFKQSGVGGGARLILTYLTMIQNLDNDAGIGQLGWYMRHAHPYWIFQHYTYKPGGLHSAIWSSMNNVPEAREREIMECLLRGFMEKNMEYPIGDWGRSEGGQADLEPVDYNPIAHTGNGEILNDRTDYASMFYRLPDELLSNGFTVSLVDSLADWGELAWPNGNWEQWMVEDSPTIIPGDASGNGSVSALDASLVLQHVIGLTTLTGDDLTAADVSGNSSVNAYDASLILQRVATLIDCFPVELGCVP